MTQRKFTDGDVIFLAGDVGDSVFTILEGKVELSRSGESERVRLALLGAGETFGASSDNQSGDNQSGDGQSGDGLRPSTAQAVGNVVVEELDPAEYGNQVVLASTPRRKSLLGGIIRLLLGDSDFFKQPLTGARGVQAERIEIRVAKIVGKFDSAKGSDAVTVDYTQHIVKALGKPRGVRVKALNKTIPSKGESATMFEEVVSISRKWLADADADLLVWGEVPSPGTTLHLRFVSATPIDESRPGWFDPSTSLNLPAAFGPEMAPLLLCTCLAATAAASDGKKVSLVKMLPDVLYAAIPIADNLPIDVISGERASILMCLANAFAVSASQAASQKIAGELFEKSVQTYRSFLTLISREESAFEWAVAKKNMGEALLALAEIRDDSEILDDAAEVFSEFLKVVTRLESPHLWASAHNSLGTALYRIDMRTGDTEVLKHSLTSFQESMKVYTRADDPLKWAEVMSNFAQAAQVLGKQLRNPEVLEKAVHACRSVLEVRKKEKTPTLWAATQNNLGSALFMLGKMTGDNDNLEGAADAFRQSCDFYKSYGASKLAEITEKNLSHVKRLLKKNAPKGVPRMRWETNRPGNGGKTSVGEGSNTKEG